MSIVFDGTNYDALDLDQLAATADLITDYGLAVRRRYKAIPMRYLRALWYNCLLRISHLFGKR